MIGHVPVTKHTSQEIEKNEKYKICQDVLSSDGVSSMFDAVEERLVGSQNRKQSDIGQGGLGTVRLSTPNQSLKKIKRQIFPT
jgi:hypothetical protein